MFLLWPVVIGTCQRVPRNSDGSNVKYSTAPHLSKVLGDYFPRYAVSCKHKEIAQTC
jgi:hypothetical protein